MRRILTLVSLLSCLVASALPAFAQAPAAIAAHTNGSNQITVAWSAVTNATGYNLYSSTTNGGPYILVNSTPLTTTSDTVSGFNDTVNEYFVVTAIVGGTESAQSQQASCRSGTPQPAAPTNLAAAASTGQVVLTWTAVTGETNYDIYRQPVTPNDATYLYVGPVTPSVNGTTDTYTDTGVTNGTAYTYAVSAVDGHGEGNLTGWVAATPLAPPALMVEATAKSSTEIDLGWTAVTGAASYTLLRAGRSGGETTYKTSLTNTLYTNTGLTANSTFYYEVIAVASDGSQSAPSGEVSATTGSTALVAPTLSGSASDGQVSLSWTSVSGASYYDLYRTPNPGTDATGFYTRVGSGTSYTDVNVTDGTAYTYKVAAGSSGGQGTLSSGLVLTPLSSPTVTATPTSTPKVSVSWTTVTGATSYQLQRATSTSGPWSVLTVTTSTSYSDPSVSFATDYYYCVHALCTGTDSGPSNMALAETCPAAPTSLAATGGNGQVVLTWTEPGGDVGGVSVYKGTSSGGEGGTYIAHGVLGTTYTDTSVTNGTRYYYNIAATDLGGASARSNEASATPTASAPGPPTLATPTAGNGKVTLSWTAGTGSVTSYKLYRSTSSNGEGSTPIETGITGTGWTDTGLSNGTTYYYEVTAFNGIGESSKSNEQSIAPVNVSGAPGAIYNVWVVEGDGHIALFWGGVSGATSYNLYKSTGGSFGSPQSIPTATTTILGGPSVVEAYDASVNDGTLYTYYVTAVSSSGEGPAPFQIPAIPTSAAAPGLPPAPGYPSVSTPNSTSASVGCNQVAGGVFYDFYRATTSGTEMSAPAVANLVSYGGYARMGFSDSSLTTGTTYYYQVKTAGTAVSNPPNSQGIPATYYSEGPASTEVSVTPGGVSPNNAPTSAPPSFTATPGNSLSSLTWGSVTGATSYNVYFSTAYPFGQGINVVVNTAALSANVLNVPYGGGSSSVQVAVSAVNSHGEGPLTSYISAALAGFGLQPVPVAVAIARGQHGSVTVNIPASNNSPASTNFLGPVSLTVTGAPSGVTAWMDPTLPTVEINDALGDGTGNHSYPANHAEGSTLFINVGTNVTPGTYTLTITGVAGTGASYAFTQTVAVALTVT